MPVLPTRPGARTRRFARRAHPAAAPRSTTSPPPFLASSSASAAAPVTGPGDIWALGARMRHQARLDEIYRRSAARAPAIHRAAALRERAPRRRPPPTRARVSCRTAWPARPTSTATARARRGAPHGAHRAALLCRHLSYDFARDEHGISGSVDPRLYPLGHTTLKEPPKLAGNEAWDIITSSASGHASGFFREPSGARRVRLPRGGRDAPVPVRRLRSPSSGVCRPTASQRERECGVGCQLRRQRVERREASRVHQLRRLRRG